MFDGDKRVTETAICDNGQIVMLDGEPILQKELDHAALEAVVATLAKDGRGALTLFEPDRRIVVGPPAGEDPGYKETQGGTSRKPVQVDAVPDQVFYKANIPCADVACVPEVLETLRREVPGLDFVSPNPKANMIDVLPKNWGKNDGAEYLRQALGLSLDEIVVFGDADNDLSIMRWATNSVAVANATPAVASAARYHIGPASEDAVADALLDIAQATAKGELPSFMQEQD